MMEEIATRVIENGLTTSVIGRSLLYYKRLGSTMGVARETARRDGQEGAVILAGIQEQGRGRLQRPWQTPAGNIALSVVLYPSIERLPCLIMMSSLAVTRSIRNVTGLQPGIKWPNDVLIGEKKVCGILIENELRPGGTAAAVIGIGINVGLQPLEYDDIALTATSLEMQTGQPVSRNDVIRELLIQLDRLYTATEPARIFAEWKQNLVTLGRAVTATWKNGSVEGIAESVEESGALVLRLPDGTTTSVVAGDVTLKKS